MIRIKTLPLAAIGVVLLFTGIFSAQLAGVWNTESTKAPAKIKTGEFAGKADPADIRGSYTWSDIEKSFGIPAAELAAAFESPSVDVKVNTLEAAWAGKLPEGFEIGRGSVSLYVALYLGLPIADEAGTLLPPSALAALEKSGKVDAAVLAKHKERLSSLGLGTAPETPAVAPSAVPAASPAVAKPVAKAPVESAAVVVAPSAGSGTGSAAKASSAPTEDHASTPGTLSGTTTFAELKAWGADEADIKKALNGKIGADGEVIKDFVSANGMKFGEVKTKLQELVTP